MQSRLFKCIEDAKNAGFRNLTIDLIYGLPDMDLSAWRSNLEIAFLLDVQHLSAYHLTIEPNTAMARMTSTGTHSFTRRRGQLGAVFIAK